MVRRNRDVDIIGTGTGVGAGAGGLKGQQERNLGNLMKIFSKKEATQALTEMAKTKPSMWIDIRDSIIGLNDFVSAGGIDKIIDSFKETVDLQIEAALSPLTNEVNQLITDWMTENITPILNQIALDLSQYIADNPTGALVGGVIGQIASIFLPGGPLLIALGAIIGAAIEDLITFGNTLIDRSDTQTRRDEEEAVRRANEVKGLVIDNQVALDDLLAAGLSRIPLIPNIPPPPPQFDYVHRGFTVRLPDGTFITIGGDLQF